MKKTYLRPKMKIRGKRRKKLDTLEGVLRVYFLPTVRHWLQEMDDRYAQLPKLLRKNSGPVSGKEVTVPVGPGRSHASEANPF